MATSGISMPARCDKVRTVSSNQASSADCAWVMTCAPVDILAIHLLISKEMNAPPKPITAAKPSKAPRFKPLLVRKRFTPNKLATTPNTNITARLVTMNKKMRFMSSSVSPAPGSRGANLRAMSPNSSRCHDGLSGYWGH